jgi:hypothetical protein
MADDLSTPVADTSVADNTIAQPVADKAAKAPLAQLTADEKKVIEERKAAKEARRASRGEETPEQRAARKAEQKAAKSERRAAETPEEKESREARREIFRKAERLERRAAKEAKVSEVETWKKKVEQAEQIRREGHKKFQEAAGLRKQFTAIRDVVAQNPAAGLVEMAKIFGLPEETLDEMFQNRMQWQRQWEGMTEDQKARFMAEQKAQQLQAEHDERVAQEQSQKQEQEFLKKQDDFEKKLSAQVIPHMQAAGLKPSLLKLKLVAATLGAIADRDGPDQEPDIAEAVAYVAEAYGTDLDETYGALDPQAFEKRYPAQMDRLRKYWLAKATGNRGAPSGTDGKPPAAPRATPRDDGEFTPKSSWSEVSKYFKNIQRGGR